MFGPSSEGRERQDYTVRPRPRNLVGLTHASRQGRAHPFREVIIGRQLELTTTSPEQTQSVAGMIAAVMRAGDVIALTGEIGAGKTCFVQGAAASLGVTDRVTSPSFILRKEYQGRIGVLHLDVYRLESMQEVLDVGFAEALDNGRITFVEWGDAMAPLLPSDHLEVELRLPAMDDAGIAAAGAAGDWLPEPRTLVLRPHGHDWTRRLVDLLDQLRPWLVDSEEA
ncbi:MAG TPA: tRNA (adenosine(37)-N6)-threonylcarbamoyltransferase complex ATPase subunit type 1 TsaE [Euzebya sp.]|nr:tRNA (adenosine(37)-N6)-threonylcarbamoyltransferase complex ATPase subunit type 1 TsaE [Euzebya sp.]